MRIESRLDRLESSRGAFGDIIALIRQGAFYDELTDEQRQQYALYKGVSPKALEDVELAVNGTLHFKIERNSPSDSIAATAAELEQLIFDYTAPKGVE